MTKIVVSSIYNFGSHPDPNGDCVIPEDEVLLLNTYLLWLETDYEIHTEIAST